MNSRIRLLNLKIKPMENNIKPVKSLKTSFSIILGIQLILIFVLGLLTVYLYQNQNMLAKSRDIQFTSYQLADQLRQSGDDLTRMVRTYVATGNPEFEREFWAVLDIRNGKIPRPLDYDNIYWDFVSATGQKPRSDGETISLHDLMVKEGFTKEEFGKLILAQENSDDLVRAETIAMNAMKGLFDDGKGNFTIKKAPDQKMASDLVNNEAYHQAKVRVMEPINDFYIMLEKRTSDAVAKYLQISKNLIFIIIVISIIILVISIASFIILRQQINQKEKFETELNVLNVDLEQKVKERTEALEKSEARIRVTLQQQEKLNKTMVGRELTMIALKKEIENWKGNVK